MRDMSIYDSASTSTGAKVGRGAALSLAWFRGVLRSGVRLAVFNLQVRPAHGTFLAVRASCTNPPHCARQVKWVPTLDRQIFAIVFDCFLADDTRCIIL